MLQQFSWTSFLIFSAVLSALWYLALAITVYRKEVSAFISGSSLAVNARAPAIAAEMETEASAIEQEIMGKTKMPEGLEVVSMAALSFSAGSSASDEESRSDQVGLIPDVLQEIKEIFAILEKEDGSKQDFFSLAAMISEKYGRIGSNPNITKINEFICNHAPFAITLEELENLWD